jgi:hypothetical protein
MASLPSLFVDHKQDLASHSVRRQPEIFGRRTAQPYQAFNDHTLSAYGHLMRHTMDKKAFAEPASSVRDVSVKVRRIRWRHSDERFLDSRCDARGG